MCYHLYSMIIVLGLHKSSSRLQFQFYYATANINSSSTITSKFVGKMNEEKSLNSTYGVMKRFKYNVGKAHKYRK
jgi:hypothetical protein